ncbi:hypothetical protein RSAG8_06744, partial [Rhizoctonia solani AG-8 WAC10335]
MELAGQMKLLGMDIKGTMGVRMDGTEFEELKSPTHRSRCKVRARASSGSRATHVVLSCNSSGLDRVKGSRRSYVIEPKGATTSLIERSFSTTMLDKLKAKLHLDSSEDKPQAPIQSNTHIPVPESHLFPIPVLTGFSTHPTCTIPNVSTISLTDKHLGIAKSTPGFSRRTICIDGIDSYEASYPVGSINPKGEIKGGFGCYLERAEFEQARDVLLSYSIKFEDGFDFLTGRKASGLIRRCDSRIGVWMFGRSTERSG